MIVANPIYDTVFKYLMEDNRIARTILSALLKMDVEEVEARRHEITNEQRDAISVFRIDFGAIIRQADGTKKHILIELQKTWLETETLRFRQYLGTQYSSPGNMVGKGRDRHALPMIAVYLLGHKVGEIEEPVIYVRHHAYDYNGKPVTQGVPNAFVDSLTHDSIIVQIPRLHGQINNRLDEVLSVFDQSLKDENDHRMLNIEDDKFEGDAEMERIVRRLMAAAADANMRKKMSVEDEIFSVVEDRDTLIMVKDKEIAEKNVRLAEQNEQLAAQGEQLAAQGEQLAAQGEQLKQLLRTSVFSLHKAGLSPETIASSLGVDQIIVNEILGQAI